MRGRGSLTLSLICGYLLGRTEDAAAIAALGFGSNAAAGEKRLVDIRFGAFFFPQKIVLAKETPIATSLRRAPAIARFQEREHVQSQFFWQQRDKVALKLRLDHRHNVFYLEMGRGRKEIYEN